ncbi:MAG: LON peptidase substrate-binding domain-containing protein [Acidobacteria bacterium]|nr:LON peptidase substrate-binding domain-containing protein [Acidobacteriota bacterium]
MQDGLLPLFPLGLVLFPRTPLGLHIFEERYKEMVGEAEQNQTEFGVVLAASNGIVNLGCTAVVSKVARRYPDGRFDIVAAGRRRFEIILLNEDKPYLRGSVQFFDDDEEGAPAEELRKRVLAHYARLRQMDEDAGPEAEAELDDAQLSFQVGQFVSDVNFRQKLLALRSETARLRELGEYLPEYLSRQTQIQHGKQVAPKNGHAKWPDSLKA